MDFWRNLFNTSDFPARWHCGRWTDGHGWLHILSDLGVWSAYFAIPCILGYFALQRQDLPFRKIFMLFVAFILLCGTTHLMEAIIFWWPAYRLAGIVKFLTATVSWVTVLGLVWIAPRAMAMRSPEELEREIFARKKAERELQRANLELERRVQERTLELAAANEALSEAHHRKDEFLATLSHELRNPLAPIRSGIEVLKMVRDDPTTTGEVLSIMERQIQQLTMLVDDLLDVSRITRGKLALRKRQVRLSKVFQSAVEATKSSIDAAGHELTIAQPEQPVDLYADPHRLAQVLANLLDNAVKYTPHGGQLRLSAERQGDEVLICVSDNGIGIAPEMLERVFEMFCQIERPDAESCTGLGIGLTLVKSLVELHDGKIEVRSGGLNQGSEFRIQLPLTAGLPSTEPPPAQPEVNFLGKLRVLIVDDNKPAANVLSTLVKMLGNEIRTAHDGQQAVEVAAEFLPDVVLMDLGMPNLNGYEAARHIRQQPWGTPMMLIALTGWGQEEDKKKSKEAGFDHHLTKPADPAELKRLLAAVEPNRGASQTGRTSSSRGHAPI